MVATKLDMGDAQVQYGLLMIDLIQNCEATHSGLDAILSHIFGYAGHAASKTDVDVFFPNV